MTRVAVACGAGATVRVTAKGHAGYDATGRDIVCSAISMLFCAASEAANRRGALISSRLDAGDAEIEMDLQDGGVADVLVCGLEMLAARYPDNVIFIGCLCGGQ